MCALSIALTLLFASPSHAQLGDPDYHSYSHEWVVTYKSHGSTSITWLGTPDEYTALDGDWPESSSGGSIDSQVPFGEVNQASQGTVTATLTWYPANGDFLLDPPDKTVYVRESATAEEHPGLYAGPYGTRPEGAGTADNGLGDPATVIVTPYELDKGLISSGTRLRQYDGSSGKIVLDPVVLSAAAPISGFPDTLDWIGSGAASVNLDVQRDTRAVTISCPRVDVTSEGDTKYREPAITGPIITNKRHPDGSLRGDTVAPPTGHGEVLIDYHANQGGWSANSTYNWQTSLPDFGGSTTTQAGTFNSLQHSNVPDLSGYYFSPPAFGGTADTITLTLQDGVDAATAVNTYSLHFHDEYEPSSWPEDSGSPYKVMGPDPDVPSWPTYPWKMVTPVIPASYVTATVHVTYKEPGIDSVEGGLDIGIEPVTLHFGASGTLTNEISVDQDMTPKPALQLDETTWVVYRQNVERHKGHLDHYGVHGYIATGVWRHDVVQGIDPNFYSPYVPAHTSAVDPPAGWNPPGYN